MTKDEIARRIKHFRKLAGLKQVDLANECGVTESAVSLWESGDRKPRDLGKVAAVCGVGLSEFFGELSEEAA